MEHVILFFSKGTQTGMPEAWPRDTASRSLFSGNHGYMCNLRRSLSKGMEAELWRAEASVERFSKTRGSLVTLDLGRSQHTDSLKQEET